MKENLEEILFLDQTSSTNTVVREAIFEGRAEGFSVQAFSQTSGYGRQGRQWQSLEGGLYLSLLLRPQEKWREEARRAPASLSLVAGLSVLKTVQSFCNGDKRREDAGQMVLKWPNDVLVLKEEGNLQKLGGISLEGVNGALCVGVGINVLRPQDNSLLKGNKTLSDLEKRITFLEDFMVFDQEFGTIERKKEYLQNLARTLRWHLLDDYYLWCQKGFGFFSDDYERAHVLSGRRITIVEPLSQKQLKEGFVEGVDSSGRLLLQTGGDLQAFSSGEVHIGIK